MSSGTHLTLVKALDTKANHATLLWIQAVLEHDIIRAIELKSRILAIEDIVREMDEKHDDFPFIPFENRLYKLCPGDTYEKGNKVNELLEDYKNKVGILKEANRR